MVELIVNPEKWDGKIVSVTGYMNFQYEGDAIFLHKEDADNWIQINGIGLLLKYDNEHNLLRKDINQKELNHKYATVTGTFKLVSRDVLYFRGDITNIESIR